MTDIAWCDPPPRNQRVWMRLLQPLTERPGKWARVEVWWSENPARCAARDLRKGRMRIPPGSWEFRTARWHGTDQWALWARYLGEDA